MRKRSVFKAARRLLYVFLVLLSLYSAYEYAFWAWSSVTGRPDEAFHAFCVCKCQAYGAVFLTAAALLVLLPSATWLAARLRRS